MYKAFTPGRILIIFLFSILIMIPVQAAGLEETPNPWSIHINIPSFRLELYFNTYLYKTYQIAVGKPEKPSPVGEYKIINKLINPTWYPPDRKAPVPPGPNNPLGKYWLGLDAPGYGIHGNNADWSIGSSVSSGCFRMHNHDIEELYRIVSVGTQVRVTYTTVFANIDQAGEAWVETNPDIYGRMPVEETLLLTLQDLGWSYQPHRKALSYLLSEKKAARFPMPRQISFVGQSSSIDGFYWNGSLYLSSAQLISICSEAAVVTNDSYFPGYFQLEACPSLFHGGYWWDESSNTLTLY